MATITEHKSPIERIREYRKRVEEEKEKEDQASEDTEEDIFIVDLPIEDPTSGLNDPIYGKFERKYFPMDEK
mgnify:CR=1 FL=1